MKTRSNKKIFSKNINEDNLHSISNSLILEIDRIFSHNHYPIDIIIMREYLFFDSVHFNGTFSLFNLAMYNKFYISGMVMGKKIYEPFLKDKKESIKEISNI